MCRHVVCIANLLLAVTASVAPAALVPVPGRLLLVDETLTYVRQVDPATGQMTDTLQTFRPQGVFFGGTGIARVGSNYWLGSPLASVSLTSGQMTPLLHEGNRITTIGATSRNGLLVTLENRIVKEYTTSGQLMRTLPLGLIPGAYQDIAWDGQYFWVSRYSSDFDNGLVAFDPVSGEVVPGSFISVQFPNEEITGVDFDASTGAFWVSCIIQTQFFYDSRIYRVQNGIVTRVATLTDLIVGDVVAVPIPAPGAAMLLTIGGFLATGRRR